MKPLIKILLAPLVLCGSVFANDFSPNIYAAKGSSNTKGDAFVSAISRLPYGAVIKKADINGYSVKKYVPGVGYIQTSGSYKCKVYYTWE